ncbi:Asparaginyl-tRNA synthetase [Trichophyton interdigitale]|uniref:asparagine--tRNA ligase n=2 Tax=Trichophyton interdigitale TaxID=101480 RepID=A0A9P4YEX2_9EURO|nr:asparagine-tRNA ligase [Trichophyton interdigitale H6]KAF3893014.1 Asparaginyl-tRNA synthetase [Trichophyton interdigitale]KAF3894515.1 Asparaginyl-tRNA synthetase [Trichophyton interdigitale]KAG8208489.1 Asparaginyl-tRNA synthetase [Trichophyton interdigitale]KDB22183.1 asparagine-tRNA ligase [Trichophyton interdigitale MR816]
MGPFSGRMRPLWASSVGKHSTVLYRRCLSTTPTRFNDHQTNPITLRCAQIFEQSKSGTGPSSLDHKELRVQGHVRFLRKQKRFAFAHISDGSSLQPIQAVLTPEQATNLTQGSAVEVTGIWQPSPPGKQQSHELQATKVAIVGEADPATYPIQKKFHTPDFLRQLPHLRLRTPFNALLSRLKSEFIYQVTEEFRSHRHLNFVQVQPPLITSSDCEGAGEVFSIKPRDVVTEEGKAIEFFKSPKYLTVSSQLHLEAYAAELGNVWTLSPTFRAEKSDTPRHLSEFYMLEVEMSYVDSLEPLTAFVETLLRNMTQRVYNSPVAQELFSLKAADDLTKDTSNVDLEKRWMTLMEGPRWPRITFAHAIKYLHEAVNTGRVTFDFSPSWSGGLQLEHEKFLVDTIGKGLPIFVTDYPKAVKPFYMLPSSGSSNENGETVACFDLLLPEICEVVGGSLREHRLSPLIQNMREHGLLKLKDSTPEPASASAVDAKAPYPHLLANEELGSIQWYADLRRWGTVPHGGFGLGFDRFVGYLAGVSSLRDLVPFPRYFGRADC